MIRIGQGIALSQRGERDAARQLFVQVWSDIGGEHGDPLHRCALAHSMADVQDDVNEELVWDLTALAAADLITDKRAAEASIASPWPSSTRRCTSSWGSAAASSATPTVPDSTSNEARLLSVRSATTGTAGESRPVLTDSRIGWQLPDRKRID